jgi:hypothetical protein
VKVRPAALKNEEAQEARKQHADDGAGEALSGYGVTVLHAYYYYDVTSSLSTSWIRFHETRGGACRCRARPFTTTACGHVTEFGQRMRDMDVG